MHLYQVTFLPIINANENNISVPTIATIKGITAAIGSDEKFWLATKIATGGFRNPVPAANIIRTPLFFPPLK